MVGPGSALDRLHRTVRRRSRLLLPAALQQDADVMRSLERTVRPLGRLFAVALPIDLTSLADFLDREAFDVEQLHHSPDYENLSWGTQGQLAEPLDLFAAYRQLGKAARGKAADPETWLVELRDAKAYEVGVYRERVVGVAATLDAMSTELEAAAAC